MTVQKLRSPLGVGLLALVLLAGACATTPQGKLLQTGTVLVAVSQVVREECERSKSQGWTPLPEQVCRDAAVAYRAAAEAWVLADDILRRDPAAPVAPYVIKVLVYIFGTVDALKKVQVPIPDEVMTYIQAVRGGLGA